MQKIKSFRLLIALIAAGLISSCNKECPEPTNTHTENITQTVWTMHYFEGTAGNDVFYAAPTFIKNGVATYPATLPHTSKWFTEYSLPVPPEINLNPTTDSIKIVANLKNPNGDGTAFEIDLNLKSDSFVAASWQKNTSAFCNITIGSQTTTNITEHINDPTNFAEYALLVQNQAVTTFKNNSQLKSVGFTGNTAGNRLETVGFAFRGYGTADWVKLYKGSKLIMSEDFNVDGKSTAVWYKP